MLACSFPACTHPAHPIWGVAVALPAHFVGSTERCDGRPSTGTWAPNRRCHLPERGRPNPLSSPRARAPQPAVIRRSANAPTRVAPGFGSAQRPPQLVDELVLDAL